jgi:hypothetical protein
MRSICAALLLLSVVGGPTAFASEPGDVTRSTETSGPVKVRSIPSPVEKTPRNSDRPDWVRRVQHEQTEHGHRLGEGGSR